jgi:hypothetical protein
VRHWKLALFTLATGCTTTHVVSVPPVASKYPVSASAAYVDHDGSSVTAQDYRVVAPFELVKLERSQSADFESTLQLGPELERLVVAANGDAITKLRIEATSFKSHQNVGTILGLSLGVIGSILIMRDFAVNEHQHRSRDPLFWTGTACFVTAIPLYVVGDFTRATSWQLKVSGQVVHSLPKPAPSPDPATASPPSAD